MNIVSLLIKEALLQEDISNKIGVMSPFIKDKWNSDFQYYLSPGPMHVKGNREFSVYVKNGKIGVYTDQQINQLKNRTAADLKNLVWYVPGGYNFGLKYKDGTIYFIARPNSAVGKSLLFNSIENKTISEFEKIVKRFSTESAIRKYLKTFDGKSPQYI